MITKPTIYRIEIYPDSFINDPIAGFCSTTPFMPLQKGDQIDPYAWGGENDESYANKGAVSDGCILEVVEIRHLIMTHTDHIYQSVSVRVIEKNRF